MKDRRGRANPRLAALLCESMGAHRRHHRCSDGGRELGSSDRIPSFYNLLPSVETPGSLQNGLVILYHVCVSTPVRDSYGILCRPWNPRPSAWVIAFMHGVWGCVCRAAAQDKLASPPKRDHAYKHTPAMHPTLNAQAALPRAARRMSQSACPRGSSHHGRPHSRSALCTTRTRRSRTQSCSSRSPRRPRPCEYRRVIAPRTAGAPAPCRTPCWGAGFGALRSRIQ